MYTYSVLKIYLASVHYFTVIHAYIQCFEKIGTIHWKNDNNWLKTVKFTIIATSPAIPVLMSRSKSALNHSRDPARDFRWNM